MSSNTAEPCEHDWELAGGGWLVLNRSKDANSSWMKFAVLEFFTSDVDEKNEMCTILFYGEGPTTVLRECRHTYWGNGGYLFYPNAKLIRSALDALSEFYDLD